jgi:hypothetical protein
LILIHKQFSKAFFDLEVQMRRKIKLNGIDLEESFGASTIVHDFYEVANYYKLDKVI